MKKFLKKRWHHIPVGIVSALLALVLVAGGAFAAYVTWTGEVSVTVDEAFSVEPGLTAAIYTDATVTWDGDTVTITDMVAGERAQFAIEITSSSSAPLDATVTMAQTSGDTTWVVGDFADWQRIMLAGGLPVPTDSQFMVQSPVGSPPDVGNPVVVTIPGGGTQPVYIWMQAGSDVVPMVYTFSVTVAR